MTLLLKADHTRADVVMGLLGCECMSADFKRFTDQWVVTDSAMSRVHMDVHLFCRTKFEMRESECKMKGRQATLIFSSKKNLEPKQVYDFLFII